MNTKKMIIAVIAVFILLEVSNYLVHSVILASTYMEETVTKVFRPMAEMEAMMWSMWIADLVFSFFFESRRAIFWVISVTPTSCFKKLINFG